MENRTDATESATAPEVRSSIAIAELIAGMSRALVSLSKLPNLVEVRLGLSEFVVLVALENDDTFTNGKLAKKIGVSAQRMNQVVSELAKAGLVDVVVDSSDSRKRFIQLTYLGRDRIKTVMDGIDKTLDSKLGSEEKSISPVSKRLARIARTLGPAREIG